MDKPLYIFEPLKQAFDTWLIVSGVFTLLLLVFIYFFRKNTTLDANRRGIVTMLLGFFILISGGTMLFRLFSQWRLKPVELYNNRIVTPYGEARLTDVRDYYIKLEMRYKPLQVNEVKDSSRYFFLIEKNDKTHVLSEGDYKIYDILDKMNEIMLK